MITIPLEVDLLVCFTTATGFVKVLVCQQKTLTYVPLVNTAQSSEQCLNYDISMISQEELTLSFKHAQCSVLSQVQ